MTKKNFKRISKGYKEGYDYVGFGWYIEKTDHWGEIWYYIYKDAECRFDEDGYVETPSQCTSKFDNLKEAREWCRNNAR